MIEGGSFAAHAGIGDINLVFECPGRDQGTGHDVEGPDFLEMAGGSAQSVSMNMLSMENGSSKWR